MKLGVLERIVLQGILPVESNYVTHKIITELRAELSFSEQEMKDFKIEQKLVGNEAKVFWNEKREKAKEIKIGEVAQTIITEALKHLDEIGKINDQNAGLYEKFVLTIKT
jgi:hypothetical protein